MPFCRECGNEYIETDQFCKKCGYQLKNEENVKSDFLNDKKISNTIIWWVAFMPLIGLSIENAGSILFNTPISNLWWITLILNIVLCYIDERKIKKIYPEIPLMREWVLLIPVYLFKRAKALKQTMAYFIVWIVMFAIICFVPQNLILNNSTLNFGLGSSQTISTVKSGEFFDYSGMSVGQAIDDYLIEEKWTSFNTDSGQQVVQVEGETPYKDDKSSLLLIQFIVANDGSFSMSYLSVDGQSQDASYFTYFLDTIYGQNN